MARDGSGVYSLPAGSTATSGETIIPSVHNTPLADIAADLNVARPVVAGGTGATTASGARTNLGLGTISTQAASAVAVTGGTIDGTAIGGTTPAAGAFTTLTSSGAASLASLDTTPIGGTTPAAGAFTTLTASGAATFGTVDINGGAIDGTPIGGTTPAAGAFTTLTASSTATFGTIDINGGAIDGTPIGASSASTGAFTTIGASGAVTLDTTLSVGGELTATGGVKFASGVYIDNSGSGLSYYTNGGDHQMNCAGGAYLALGNAGHLSHYYPVSTGTTTIASFRSDQPGTAVQVAVIKANGDINNATGAYGTISDARLKENIVDASPQWEDIKAMRFRNYNLIGQDKVLLGVVTQELIEAGMAGLVGESDDELKTQYAKMSVLFTKCAKGLQEAILRIEELEGKVG